MFSNVATKAKQVLSSLEFWVFCGGLYLIWLVYNIFEWWPFFYYKMALSISLTILCIWGFGWLIVSFVKRKRSGEKLKVFQLLSSGILGIATFLYTLNLLFYTVLGTDTPPNQIASLNINTNNYIVFYDEVCYTECVYHLRLYRCDQNGKACQLRDYYLTFDSSDPAIQAAYTSPSLQLDKTTGRLNLLNEDSKLVYTFKSP